MQSPHDLEHADALAPAPASSPSHAMARTLANSENQSRSSNRWSRVISIALLTSIAVVPYVLVRRKFWLLHLTLRETARENTALQRKVIALSSQVAAHREESRQSSVVLREVHEHMQWLRAQREERDAAHAQSDGQLRHELMEIRQDLERLQMEVLQKDRARTRSEEACNRQLQALLQEKEWTRDHISALRAIGASLADIAAFMHETEVELGYQPRRDDGRGIEKIRQLALKIQNLPPPLLEDMERTKPNSASKAK